MYKVLRSQFRPICILIAVVFSLSLAKTSQSHASWKDDLGTLRIGVLDTNPITTNEKTLSEFSTFYANQLGLKVEVIRFNSLGSLMDAHGSARVHYAIHSARSYATMARICNCLHAIARPVSEKGSVGFRSVLVIRDKKKESFASGEKLRIGFSQKNSMSGWIIPNSAIENEEVIESDFLELGSVEDVVSAYERGDIDGFFGWVPISNTEDTISYEKIFDGFYNSRLKVAGASSIAWWSEIIHNGPHAVHRSLPDELSETLTDLLVNMNNYSPEIMDIIEPYFSGGFERASAADYNAISAALNLSAINVPAIFNNKLRLMLR